MKIQTSAMVEKFIIAGEPLKIKDGQTITLEFSALDTGSSFHDKRLDFVFEIQINEEFSLNEDEESSIQLTVGDASKKTCVIHYRGKIKYPAEKVISGYGRLQEDQLSDGIVGFMLAGH